MISAREGRMALASEPDHLDVQQAEGPAYA